MSDALSDHSSTNVSIALFSVIAVLIGWDVVADYRENADWLHIAVELFVLLVAASGVVLLRSQLRQARSDLTHARMEALQWRRETRGLMRGLGAAIEKQFAIWQLTRAEAEVGLLLLKGLSHREISDIRQTSERTVREQARGLYRKSGLSGRSELSAFFLEDLLLPLGESLVESAAETR